ncbi:hypothetical protein H4R23_002908 [Coemansia sp. Cherry 401B]|nr:hypothetical protein H4R23_002908 [Coemansia sp. Cherry 401B]
MPSSPGRSSSTVSSAASPHSSVSVGPCSGPLSLGADLVDAAKGDLWGYVEVPMRREADLSTDEATVPLIGSESIELVDIGALAADDGASEVLEQNDMPGSIGGDESSIDLVLGGDTTDQCLPPASMNSLTAIELVCDTVRELGSVSGVCSCAVVPATRPESLATSPYVVRDIDELLVELGIADSFISSSAKDAANPPTLLEYGVDDDSFSLREIDELLQQLDEAAEISATRSMRPMSQVLDVARVIRNLGDVDAVARAACRVSLVDLQCKAVVDAAVDPAEAVASLGNPQALVAAAVPFDVFEADARKVFRLVDPAELIRSLGRVMDIAAVEPLAVGELIHLLGSPDDIVDLAIPEAPEFVDVGRADSMCPVSNLPAPVSPLLDVPDIISNLGGVYTPDFILCNVERVRKASTQTLVDDEPSSGVSLEPNHYGCKFSNLPLSSAKSHIITLTPALLELSMDVDEAVVSDSRSRTSSIVSYDQPFVHSISKLMAALRIQPIVVSRPFLGPSRSVLFPHLY